MNTKPTPPPPPEVPDPALKPPRRRKRPSRFATGALLVALGDLVLIALGFSYSLQEGLGVTGASLIVCGLAVLLFAGLDGVD